MTPDQQLEAALAKYNANSLGAQTQVNAIWPVIQKWAGIYLIEGIYSGSLAKGTAVSLSSDADVFISLSSSTPDSLADIYGSLHANLVAAGYSATKQNVSIGVRIGHYRIDFVPGKRQSTQGYDHSLYRHRGKTWTKTNVKTHEAYVSRSGRTREIRLTKIWRALHNVDFPSFYLELAVIEALLGEPTIGLANNFWKVLEFLATAFPTRRYIDPANTNNVVSDDLSPSERLAVKQAAVHARQQQYWRNIVW